MVNARSKKLGLNTRKIFGSEKEALDFRNGLLDQVRTTGAQTDLPREKLIMADAYDTLCVRLGTYNKRPEDAVDHYIKFLGEEALKALKPPIKDLVGKWQEFKLSDTTLSKPMVRDISSYARFIKRKWGDEKPDEPAKNEIDLVLRRLKVSNNTRRKYLKFIRMFFSWACDEGHILRNPTAGIRFKADDFSGDFYSVETTKKLLRYVAQNEKDLAGYYALLTFAGLRPTEGARVQWDDLNFKTGQLYVRKGKTEARHITLEPTALEWMKFHRENTPQDGPFVRLRALPNREKSIRKAFEAFRKDGWIQDGLRHGFATYFKNLKKNDIGLVSFYMGNSADVVKRHYARTIPDEDVQAFWALSPTVVLASEIGQPQS